MSTPVGKQKFQIPLGSEVPHPPTQFGDFWPRVELFANMAVVANAAGRAFLASNGDAYDGLAVVESDTGLMYVRKGGAWVALMDVDDTGWIFPTLQNSWASSGGFTVGYRRRNGVVYFTGRAAGGSTNPIFTLPTGFRPAQIVNVAVISGSSSATTVTQVYVDPAGIVQGLSASTPNLSGFVPFPVG